MSKPLPPEVLTLITGLAPQMAAPALSKVLGVDLAALPPQVMQAVSKLCENYLPDMLNKQSKAAAPQAVMRQARDFVFLGNAWDSVPEDVVKTAVGHLIFAPVPMVEVKAPDGQPALQPDDEEEARRYLFASRLMTLIAPIMAQRVAAQQAAAAEPQKASTPNG